MSAHIVVDGDQLRIFTPYHEDFVADIRDLPARRWDRDERCWIAPTALLEAVERICLTYFDDVKIDGDPRQHSQPLEHQLADCLHAVFRLAARDRRERLWRALAAVLHPDVGGDSEAMRTVNGVWDHYRKDR